ncbi:pilus assembly protein TadG-related protein [Rhodovulum sp. DZ06]|uniref:pilus assembly protein TadG-related protein n=1 Tax=Rhodovulum sp. DZ06 TaxID=3425126 RepID=UPI003D32CF42
MLTKRFDPAVRARTLAARTRDAFAEERGSTTVWAICWTIGFAMLGGVAMDSTNAYTYKTRLQAVADASALAAAMKIKDRAAARTAAIELAALNMPVEQHGQVIRPEDIVFGKYNGQGEFVALPDPSQAAEVVQVMAGRDTMRGNPVPTWMFQFAGQENWSVSAKSVAVALYGGGGWTGGGGGDCPSANIISTGMLQTAANNTYEPGVCFHGHEEVKTAGNDYMPAGVYVTAPSVDLVTLGMPLKDGSASPDAIVQAMETETPMLDAMDDGLFSAYWSALSTVGSTKMYTIGGLGPAQNYFGPPLPESVFMPAPNVAGRANYRNNLGIPAKALKNFKFEDGQIKPYDVWQWNGDMNFTGGVSLSQTALFVDGDVNFGGGADVVLKDVFIFATGEIKNAGNAQMGYTLSEFCDIGEYTVTLISGDRTTLGGNGNSGKKENEAGGASDEPIKGAFGVMIVAGGGLNAGGALHQAGGLYIEARESKTNFAGNMHLRTCDKQLSSFLEPFILDDEASEDGLVSEAIEGVGDVLGGAL